jgi:hypothetical protein
MGLNFAKAKVKINVKVKVTLRQATEGPEGE